jgi:hypothetical protein
VVKTQVQIPDELFRRAKAVAADREWSFAELVRRGLEQMVARQPVDPSPDKGGWKLPEPVELGLTGDPFANPDWREDANVGSVAGRLIRDSLREQGTGSEELR